tara:strand:+ start:8516 stop:9112 length:597 start_codon:yes stop_codon:yes gene_type:complete
MAITQGHEVLCCDKNRRGGIKNIWLVESGDITGGAAAVTFGGTNGAINAFPTLEAYPFQFDRNTAGFNANATRENGSTLVNVELEFYIPKITQEVRNRLKEISESCGIHAIVESYADDCAATPATYFFVLGFDTIFADDAYLEFSSGDMQTGVGLQDANGTAVKLMGVQGEYPLELIVGTGGVTFTPGTLATDAATIA